MLTEDGLAMTYEFCDSFVTACGAELALPDTYCNEHVLDNRADAPVEYWSYPLDIDGKKRAISALFSSSYIDRSSARTSVYR